VLGNAAFPAGIQVLVSDQVGQPLRRGLPGKDAIESPEHAHAGLEGFLVQIDEA